ncbi:phosphoribosylglycinamide formyltransferase [Candidatus Pelagibacter sp.]|nr:phosphoribosylglycinamide formyltransferase [Candidatus Pelagibacter sp.]|tara:strand:- start:316 stop:924 length:609 start_codon:yes stop_codon:yes gene_type:complete
MENQKFHYMVKLIGENKIQCAVFISGRGTNLKSIFNFSKTKHSKINIQIVISNKHDVDGLKFAKKNKIKTKIFNFNNIVLTENRIIKLLKKNNIKYIFLAGFMKILSKRFIKKFKNPILNIHPSLLPKYKGLNTHKKVIQNKEKFSGCTVHFVNEKLDSGKIIMKKKVKVLKKDTPNSLSMKILKEENKLYPKAISKIISKI